MGEKGPNIRASWMNSELPASPIIDKAQTRPATLCQISRLARNRATGPRTSAGTAQITCIWIASEAELSGDRSNSFSNRMLG